MDKTWQEAQDFCAAIGADLPAVPSSTYQAWVIQIFSFFCQKLINIGFSLMICGWEATGLDLMILMLQTLLFTQMVMPTTTKHGLLVSHLVSIHTIVSKFEQMANG